MSFLRMAHRLTSHHRALYSPQYYSGTCAHITTTSVYRAPFDIKDEEDFNKRVLQATKPTVVDFHANWCNPCKVLTPRLDAIIAEQDGKVDLAKVDIDVMGELAFNFGVNAVPTVIGMKGGKVINKFEGVVEPPQIRHFIEQLTKA
ncbi:thioredoxin, mitochondrial [Nematostella vectensis]|nr:thioredoxin, mitochondrial [Nematostella vectensis]